MSSRARPSSTNKNAGGRGASSHSRFHPHRFPLKHCKFMGAEAARKRERAVALSRFQVAALIV